ncbi:TerB family tellurite resistance protein [Litorimonas sp. RW-G-Af-16]|uniref:TerB family tellurite resistance protein n=1 Tax=Litorimonas sp. RW-G-Af-16 TaxID=3241168 RepID=UPI00390C80D5
MNFWQSLMGAGARLFGPPMRPDPNGEAGPIEQAGLVAALVALGAKMAKADGQVRQEDVAAFKQVFRPDAQTEAAVGRFFDLARQTTRGYEHYARVVAKRYRAQPAVLEDVLDGLFHIALADGIVTDDEATFLLTVSDIFGFSEREFERIRATHTGQASTDPYLILGVDEDISDADLRRAYHRQAAANHPDRLMARGLPAELAGLANHKMAMINRAYAEICAQRAKARAPLSLK